MGIFVDKVMDITHKKKLKTLFPESVELDIPLSTLSQWKVGGNAELVVRPKNKSELIELRKWLYEYNVPSVVIGNTTNLLFSDEGLKVVCIKIDNTFSNIAISDNMLTVTPGVWVPELARAAMNAGLSGIEHICGIPGTVGGLVVMNGGSQRKGIGSVVTRVETINTAGALKTYNNEECGFSYRSSIFQKNNELITEVQLILDDSKSKEAIRQEMLAILLSRRGKFPRKQPNYGSVFVSNPDMYSRYGTPGKVIENCGLKGMTQGDAQVSDLHANFIINKGNAKAVDIIYLINKVREVVYNHTGYKMVVEAKFVSPNGKVQNI